MSLSAKDAHRATARRSPSRDLVVETYRRRFGGSPSVVVRAPGRVNLIGAHIDHLDGWALPGAIDRAVWLAASPTADLGLTLVAADLGEEAELDLKRLPSPKSPLEPLHWSSYPLAIAAALRDSGRDLCGMTAVYGGDLPRDAGVSSSAAVEMAFALAWRRFRGWDSTAAQLATAGRRAENVYLGVQSGAMDQMACLSGRAGAVVLLDCSDLVTETIDVPPHLALLVIDSGVRRRLSGSGYNNRRSETITALQLLRQRDPELRSLRDLTPARFDEHARYLPEIARRRARHVVHECRRVLTAADALRRADLDRLATAIRDSHQSSRLDYEVSTGELDTLAEAAWDAPG